MCLPLTVENTKKRPGMSHSKNLCINLNIGWGATISQWIHLRLPSCRPGFSTKHTIYAFSILKISNCMFVTWNWNVKRTKINEKRAGLDHLKKPEYWAQSFPHSLASNFDKILILSSLSLSLSMSKVLERKLIKDLRRKNSNIQRRRRSIGRTNFDKNLH